MQTNSQSDFSRLLQEFEKKKTISGLQEGRHDQAVETLIQLAAKKEELHELAYQLFSGEAHVGFNLGLDQLTILAYLFPDPVIAVADIKSVLSEAFASWKKAYKPSELKADLDNPNPFTSEDEIFIHHGGGLRHLDAFLRGEESSGYKCHKHKGLIDGIFVSWAQKVPQAEDKSAWLTTRSPEYAYRAPVEHFDIPAIFQATIQAKYLVPTTNGYERILPKGSVQYLKHTKVTQLPMDNYQNMISQLPMPASADRAFPRLESAFRKKIQESLDKAKDTILATPLGAPLVTGLSQRERS